MIIPTRRSRTPMALTANTTNSFELASISDITQMNLLFSITVDVAAGAAPAIDGLQKFIHAIRVQDNESRSFVNVNEPRALVHFNKLLIPNNVQMDVLPTAVGSHTLQMEVILHPGRKHGMEFDSSLIFPGADVKYLQLEVVLGTATDLGTGYTLGAMTLETTLASLQYENQLSERSAMFPRKPAVANIGTEKTSLTAAVSNLGQEIEVPPSRFYMTTLLMVLNAAGERSDAIVERLTVKFPVRQDKIAWEESWASHKNGIRRKYPNLSNSDLTGIVMVDWAEICGLTDSTGTSRTVQDKGFNTFGMDKGDVIIGATTTAAGSIIRLNHYGLPSGQ